MKIKSNWSGKEVNEVIEMKLPEHGAILVMICNKDPSLSKIATFNKDELQHAQKDPTHFKEWLQASGYSTQDQCEIRILSLSNDLPAFLAFTKSISLRLGKEVSLNTPASTIQFIPKEGRIRIPIDSKNSIQNTKKATERTRVLVIDDSDTIRKLLQKIIDSDPELECVGTVEHPLKAEEAIQRLKPQVITMDIHMPEMTGVQLVKKIAPKYKIPIIMISSLSMEDGNDVLEALESGAVDYIQKPSMNELPVVAPIIREKIKSVSQAKITFQAISPNLTTQKTASIIPHQMIDVSYLIAIGSSTGGTEALRQILTSLPEVIPPIVIVQHIPAVFSKAFADRMNELCPFTVKEAEEGEIVKTSYVYIAPGGKQMKLKKRGAELYINIDDSAPVNRHKPSVDYLFDSIVELKLSKITAGILTGMGADGAKGLLKLRQQGAQTFAQDEATSVVYGMPREAARNGGADKILPIHKVASELLQLCSLKQNKKTA